MPRTDRDAGQRAAKVGTTKSRGGCVTCRQRRVRCDQARPACNSCTRLGLDCVYNAEQSGSGRLNFRAYELETSRPTASAPVHAGSSIREDETPISESKERRLLELRLLHHWMTVVSRPFPSTPAPRWGELWRADLPLIALRSQGVLHALLAMAATHLLRTTTESQDHAELLSARDRYFAHALAAQRTAVQNLNVANVDEASFSALLISLTAFSMLRERPLQPYTPPTDWLEMGYGAGVVMRQAAELLKEMSPSKAREIIETTIPIHRNFESRDVDDETLRPYKPLLQSLSPDNTGALDAAEIEACTQAIHIIATLRKAITAGEPEYVHLRRICMFPFLVTAKFIDLVRQQRAIALVVLAHFFAAISDTEALAYLGNSGDDASIARREVVAIHEHVPKQSHSLLIWAMDEVRA